MRYLETAHMSQYLKIQFRHDRKSNALIKQLKLKLNSVVLVRKQTIPTERPQPVGEVSADS
jgi:hypothetical protein